MLSIIDRLPIKVWYKILGSLYYCRLSVFALPYLKYFWIDQIHDQSIRPSSSYPTLEKLICIHNDTSGVRPFLRQLKAPTLHTLSIFLLRHSHLKTPLFDDCCKKNHPSISPHVASWAVKWTRLSLHSNLPCGLSWIEFSTVSMLDIVFNIGLVADVLTIEGSNVPPPFSGL